MKKWELEQIIADQADQIAALIERNDQLLTINEETRSIAVRALDLCDKLRTENEKFKRTIGDILNDYHSQDINFPNTEG